MLTQEHRTRNQRTRWKCLDEQNGARISIISFVEIATERMRNMVSQKNAEVVSKTLQSFG